MKIALVGLRKDFTQNSGNGIQRYIFELYRNLKVLINGDIRKIGFKQIRFVGDITSFMFGSLIENYNGYDIIHNPTQIRLFKPKILMNSILVSTAHEFRPILYPEYVITDKTAMKDKMWLKFVAEPALKHILSSDYLFANSTQTREEAIMLGFNKKKILVINLGIDKRFTKVRYEKDYIKNNFKIGYVGALKESKNISFAIDAFNLIERKNISFEIYGNGPDLNSLYSHIKNRNIIFKGFAPEKKLLKIYDSFDIFVAPSKYEGFGLPILEAQSRGLPVIIYKYGKIPKEVRKYCFEAESPEHMAQIIENIKENGYNEKLRKKATAYARSFTWEKGARETLEVYEKVLEK